MSQASSSPASSPPHPGHSVLHQCRWPRCSVCVPFLSYLVIHAWLPWLRLRHPPRPVQPMCSRYCLRCLCLGCDEILQQSSAPPGGWCLLPTLVATQPVTRICRYGSKDKTHTICHFWYPLVIKHGLLCWIPIFDGFSQLFSLHGGDFPASHG